MTADEQPGTIAVLGQRMDEMLRRQDRMESKVDRIAENLQQISLDHTKCAAIQETRWKQHDEEHRDLNVKKWAGDVAAALAAALVGIFVKSP